MLMLATPVLAFDGKPEEGDPAMALKAARNAATAMRDGNLPEALKALQYAADNGHLGSAWKLGRMYATGEGVDQNDLRAFEAFRRIAANNADVAPSSPNARYVASAYVRLGDYWLEGIPRSYVKPTPERAYEHFRYAASTFGDADAQYRLARLLLDGTGCERDVRQATQWLSSAAHKSHHAAQATLGQLLFVGKDVPRQAPRGLMFLTLAKEGADRDDNEWITDAYDSAMNQSSDEERMVALSMMRQWLSGRR